MQKQIKHSSPLKWGELNFLSDKDLLLHDAGVIETQEQVFRFNNIGELIDERFDLLEVLLYINEL